MATGGAAGALRRFELDRVHDTGTCSLQTPYQGPLVNLMQILKPLVRTLVNLMLIVKPPFRTLVNLMLIVKPPLRFLVNLSYVVKPSVRPHCKNHCKNLSLTHSRRLLQIYILS